MGKEKKEVKKERAKPTSWYGRFWHFLWYQDSFLSWITLLILSFLIIKFGVYPGLGFVLGTSYPVVAVISESMDHHLTDGEICGQRPSYYDSSFEEYWRICGNWYEQKEISEDTFRSFSLPNGFRRGDIIVLRGKDPKNINIGDIIVFRARQAALKPDPIIHRVVKKERSEGEAYLFQTKGDHNPGIHEDQIIDEREIREDRILGVAWFKIPWLGFVKIYAVELFSTITK